MKRPHISVIIPAFNEEKLLPRLLQSLIEQSYKDFEVIIVDAKSSDKTVSEAKSFSDKLEMDIIEISEKNVSASRNLGASKAKSDLLFFIDADNFIRTNFLEEINKLFDKNYDMIVPSIIPDSRSFYYNFAYKMTNFLVGLAEKFNLSFSTGGNLAVKKEVFEALEGFDKTIFVGEDHDIVGRARKKGFKVVFARKPKVIFSVRRLEKEGGAVLLKYFFSTLYIVLFGKMTRKLYNYEMGGKYYEKKG